MIPPKLDVHMTTFSASISTKNVLDWGEVSAFTGQRIHLYKTTANPWAFKLCQSSCLCRYFARVKREIALQRQSFITPLGLLLERRHN